MRKILIALAVLCRAASAESGVVKSAGQPIPGATVTAKAAGQTLSTTTGPDGRYTLPKLPTGAASIEVRMFGFAPLTKQEQISDVPKPIDFTLVLAESPMTQRMGQFTRNAQQSDPTATIDTTTAEPAAETLVVSGSVSQGLAQNAPPDFRPDFFAMGIGDGTPGGNPGGNPGGGPVAGGPPGGGFGGGPGFGGGGFGGGRGGPGGGGQGRQGGRGAPGNPAQFGNRRRASGIHGMVFDTLNNSALNAKPFSISGADIFQPAYAQNRLGLVIGGPLVIPHLVKDPATFFSVNYFVTRARNPFSATGTVPTQDQRDQAPPGSIAAQLLSTKYFPLPNATGITNNYQFYASVPANTQNLTARLQRNLNKKDRLAYHIGFQTRDAKNAQTFGFLDTATGLGFSNDLTWTRTISTHLINSAKVTFNRNRNETTPFFANSTDTFGIAGRSTNPLDAGPPNLNFTNYTALTDAVASLTRNQIQIFDENLIWIRGQQSFTFGAEYRRSDLNSRSDPNGRGTFNFTGQNGADFTAFLLGLPQSASIRYGDSSTYFIQNAITGFVNDEWKAHARLTINAGVRWEYFSPLSEKYGHIANLDIAPGYAAIAVVTPNTTGPYTGGFPSGLVNSQWNHFSPRIGLAWKVPKIKRSTLVRAGYGIYYNGQAYNSFARQLAQQPPFATSLNVNAASPGALTLSDAFVSVSPTDITNSYAVDRFYKTPYAQTWNLSIQHELPKGFFIDVSYLGTKGTHLDVLTVPQIAGATARSASFTFDSSNGNSIYHALTIRANQRFRRGFSLGTNYTFSKSIDDSSTFGGAGNTVAQNWLDISGERGLSSFDKRHSFDANFVATAPWTNRIAKDWTLSGGVTAATGTPLTARIISGGSQLALTNGVGSLRAEATGLPIENGSGFFNLAAFATPALNTFGNAGRNTIPGPGSVALNLNFGRSFTISDRRRLEMRVEANNILNHVNYTNIDTVVNSTNYGLPLTASGMRTLSLVGRFRF